MKQVKILVVLALTVGSAMARAQPSGAQAEAWFREGKELMAKGQIAEGCAALDTSQRLDPTIATLLNLASCREKNSQLATAWGLFLEAERQTRTATDDATKRLHQIATSHATKLEPRLSTLKITVPLENRVGGLQILRNTEPVDPGAWSKTLPIDGGTYKITAGAPGNAEWSSTITISNEHDVKTIEIPKLTAAVLEPRVAALPPAPQASATESTKHQRSRVVPLITGGAAITLAGGALGFGLWGSSTYSKAKTEPDDALQASLWHSANTKRHVAEGLGVVGLACAGVAVWLYLRSGNDETSPTTRVARAHLAPIFSSDRVEIFLIGGY